MASPCCIFLGGLEQEFSEQRFDNYLSVFKIWEQLYFWIIRYSFSRKGNKSDLKKKIIQNKLMCTASYYCFSKSCCYINVAKHQKRRKDKKKVMNFFYIKNALSNGYMSTFKKKVFIHFGESLSTLGNWMSG